VSNLMIEQSYKPKDSQDYVTQTISITPEQAQGLIFGLQKSVEQSMEKLANKDRGTGRTA
jgi:hypothetical protein